VKTNYRIEPISSIDIQQCAKILMDIYNNTLNEGWTDKSSYSTCEYYFKKQPDLFLVAKEGNAIMGFTFSYVRPWADGNQLMIEELSVKKEYRKQGIARNLLANLIATAKDKYSITRVNGTTYNGVSEMPFSWYKRIGFKKVEELFLIEGDSSEILNGLKK